MDDPYKLAKNILLSGEGGPIAAPGGGFTSIELYGASASENAAADGGVRFHLENESGTGDITLYRVFPGIELVYNDMHMAYCNKHQQPAANVMEINYCKEAGEAGGGGDIPLHRPWPCAYKPRHGFSAHARQ